ncbi:MAG: hypothetical protein EXS36_16325 [Pedosphaera sp.]|nr:hypothetical protein [Pedosphaera sp.]
MNAFIYAAGRATRLGPAYANSPKILIEIGGRSLLDWHIQRLASVGVRKIFIVTGHVRKAVASVLPALRSAHNVELDELVNLDFNEGSVLSVAASLPLVLACDCPVLMMDGDVLYPSEMLRRLIDSQHPTCLLMDCNYSTEDDDPVLVPMRGGQPFDFSKGWRGEADHVGESIGFFKISPADFPLLAEETRRRAAGAGRRDSYDDVVRTMVVAGRFGAEDVTGLPWTEVDFPKDVEFARSKVLPAIQRRELMIR